MCHHGIDRQHDLAPGGSCFGEDSARGHDEVGLAERLADGFALRRQERVGHAAADDQRVDFRQQIAEEIELGRNLGAADDRRHRPLRRMQGLLQRLELGLHGAAGIGRKLVAQSFRRSVGPVRDREGVVDVNVAEPGERGDEIRIVLHLAGVEAGILQAQNVARLHGVDGRFGDFADAILGESDRPSNDARRRGGDPLERILWIATFRPAEVREQDDLAAAVGDLPDRRRRALDARRVRQFAVIHRHVKIDAHEHTLALHVGVVEAAEAHFRSAQISLRLARDNWWCMRRWT